MSVLVIGFLSRLVLREKERAAQCPVFVPPTVEQVGRAREEIRKRLGGSPISLYDALKDFDRSLQGQPCTSTMAPIVDAVRKQFNIA
jgi:hypothetical protein